MKQIRRGKMKTSFLLGLGLLILLPIPVLAADLNYPTRPVNLIVGFAPGGAASIAANIYVEALPRHFNKPYPFIILHKPGAATMIAADYFIKQPADGYNLFWESGNLTPPLVMSPRKYDFTLNDISYLGHLAFCPYLVAVPNNSPFKTLEDYIDYAKKNPLALTCASPGMAGGAHLALEMLMQQAGVQITHIPFPSGAPGVTAMLGGHVSSYVGAIGMFTPHFQSGRARALVIFDEKRFPPYPDIPTAKEKGYNIVRGSTFALLARKGTPKPICDYLENLFKQLTNDSVLQSNLFKAGISPRYMSPEETEKFYNQDYKLVSDILNKLGLIAK